jgi:hypothetical protein
MGEPANGRPTGSACGPTPTATSVSPASARPDRPAARPDTLRLDQCRCRRQTEADGAEPSESLAGAVAAVGAGVLAGSAAASATRSDPPLEAATRSDPPLDAPESSESSEVALAPASLTVSAGTVTEAVWSEDVWSEPEVDVASTDAASVELAGAAELELSLEVVDAVVGSVSDALVESVGVVDGSSDVSLTGTS